MRTFLKYTLLLLVISISYSCTEEEKNVAPENLIPQPEMIVILTDICKVEARFQRRLSIRSKNNSELILHNYKVIFDQNKVDLEQFKTSYEYYEESPETMQELYDSVIVHLTQEQTSLEELEPDSLSVNKNQ